MIPLEIVSGSKADFPLQCTNRGGQTTPVFGASDTLAAAVFGGQALTTLFAPTVGWYTASNTQSGYGQGQVLLTIAAEQSATLEYAGDYSWVVWLTPSGTSEKSAILRGSLKVLNSPGSAAQTTLTYNTYHDMLRYAPWVSDVVGAPDSEGFYDQRLEAREWLDWAVTNCYRGAAVGNFEQLSTLAFAFGGGVGWRRGIGPSPSMVQWLADNLLILRPQVVRACAYKSISLVGLAQIGRNATQASYGAYFRDMAERELTATTAEIDLNSDGIGEIFVNLGSTNTLQT